MHFHPHGLEQMKKLSLIGLVALCLFTTMARAERLDGIEYGASDNLELKRLDSVKGTVGWVDDTYDLQSLGKFGDGVFWVSDKSVRRNWQAHVILKMFKTYEKPKFFKPTNDPFKRKKRLGYTHTESIVAFDCQKKFYSIKAESWYSSKLELVNSEVFEEDFVAFKAGTVMERLHQKYCF